jgi:uncharacterized membrane protein YkvA (DUF1232 family)
MSFRQTAALDQQELAPESSSARDEQTVRERFWPKFRRFAASLPFAEDLLTAYYCAFDRDTPLHVKTALIGALAYFVLPFDAVPDLLLMVGFADDAAALLAALRLVTAHIRPVHREAARAALERLQANASPPDR